MLTVAVILLQRRQLEEALQNMGTEQEMWKRRGRYVIINAKKKPKTCSKTTDRILNIVEPWYASL